jgi:hypothetical protein
MERDHTKRGTRAPRCAKDPNEVILTPSNVNASSFGLLFNLLVDGKVDAQPLYVSSAPAFSGTTSLGNHNLVIVATEHDSGQEVAGSPVEIQASFSGFGPNNDGRGHVIFDLGAYKERPGLLLLNGIVYTAWSSHCDNPPYTSWIIGLNRGLVNTAGLWWTGLGQSET